MNAGIALLALAYVLSQFFRAFLAVLSPFLATDIGAGASDLAFASGLWFLTFSVMQLPIGWALDTVGPRRTAATLLMLGGAGDNACACVDCHGADRDRLCARIDGVILYLRP